MAQSRRVFVKSLAAAWPMWNVAEAVAARPERVKLPVAGVCTCFRNAGHADVIYSKITEGWEQNGGPGPSLKLVSLFIDQPDPKDPSHAMVAKHNIRVCETIDEALTHGTNELKVSGVLIVGEHGNYPKTPDTQQVMYPRREFFDAVVKTFRRVGKTVPVFNDKHLSYNWANAKHMYDTAREMKFPMLAGSSVPVSWRVPEISLDRGCKLREAIGIGYGGLEAYGFHALEGLQTFVERRGSGETGVVRVETVTGEAIWETARAGRWSKELFEAALDVAPRYKQGDVDKLLAKSAAWMLIEYKDGLRAAIAMAVGATDKFAFATKLEGAAKPLATHLALQEGFPTLHFANLLRAIDELVHTGKSPYPVERTLLTTGVLHAAMQSAAQAKAIETPHLNIAYEPTDWPYTPGKPPASVRPDAGSQPRVKKA